MSETTKKSAREIGAEIEAQSKDMAYKIWLAGVGAYGRAYSETKQGAEKVNEGAADLFEDLVKRGAEIENDVRERISSNETLTKGRSQMTKAFEAATHFQDKQRERFEARMDRMRSVFGLSRQDDEIRELTAKIDQLTEQVASLAGEAAPTAKAKAKPAVKAKPAAKPAPSETPAERIARLGKEIGGDAPAKPAPRKSAARKTTAAKPATKAKKTATARKSASA